MISNYDCNELRYWAVDTCEITVRAGCAYKRATFMVNVHERVATCRGVRARLLIRALNYISERIRWKERYVVLSTDTLYTFKKATSSISEKGQFVMKVGITFQFVMKVGITFQFVMKV